MYFFEFFKKLGVSFEHYCLYLSEVIGGEHRLLFYFYEYSFYSVSNRFARREMYIRSTSRYSIAQYFFYIDYFFCLISEKFPIFEFLCLVAYYFFYCSFFLLILYKIDYLRKMFASIGLTFFNCSYDLSHLFDTGNFEDIAH